MNEQKDESNYRKGASISNNKLTDGASISRNKLGEGNNIDGNDLNGSNIDENDLTKSFPKTSNENNPKRSVLEIASWVIGSIAGCIAIYEFIIKKYFLNH